LYVAASGTNSGSCTSSADPCATVTYALTQAGINPTIEVSGTIDDNVTTSSSVTITGAQAPPGSPAVLDGTGVGAVVAVGSGGSVTLDHLTLQHGSSSKTFAYGGGIYNFYGTVNLTDSTVTDNTAQIGGGIANGGVLTVSESTISDNSASSSGGGISNFNGTVTVTDSTISGNSAAFGGGISNGIGTTTLTSSTISGNSGGGGIDDFHGQPVTAAASIVAGNAGGNCTGGPYISVGYNQTDDATGAGCGLTQSTDLVNETADLGPLGDNGGPTLTMLPAPTSPAAGAIPVGTTLSGVAVCPGTDQRGVVRPQPSGGTTCTIGAVEVAPVKAVPPAFTSAPNELVGTGWTFSYAVTATGTPVPAISLAAGSSLPTGVTLVDMGTGTATLAGTASVVAGVYVFTLDATNGFSPAATQVFTLTITLDSGRYTMTLTTTQGSVYHYSLTLGLHGGWSIRGGTGTKVVVATGRVVWDGPNADWNFVQVSPASSSHFAVTGVGGTLSGQWYPTGGAPEALDAVM
jgi:hypothetical protein